MNNGESKPPIVADAEHEFPKEGVFSELKERGLTKVILILSDHYIDIQSAAGRMLRNPYGRCITFTSFSRFSETFHENINERSQKPQQNVSRIQVTFSICSSTR